MTRKVQTYFAALIAGIYLVGLFLPYETQHAFDMERLIESYKTYYGWETISFRIFFTLCALIVGFSFLSYIAVRLLIIRSTLVFFIPTFIIVFLNDASFMSGGPYASERNIGCYLNYLGAFLTIIYGIIHFRTSYPKYKKMLNQEQKNESDLLDV